jgi:hypothetical protein
MPAAALEELGERQRIIHHQALHGVSSIVVCVAIIVLRPRAAKGTGRLPGCGAEEKTVHVLGSCTSLSCSGRLERIGHNVAGGAQDQDTMHTRQEPQCAMGCPDLAARAQPIGRLSCPGGDPGNSLGLGRDAEPWELCQGCRRYAVRCWRRQPYASRPIQPMRGGARCRVRHARQLPALGAYFLFPPDKSRLGGPQFSMLVLRAFSHASYHHPRQ